MSEKIAIEVDQQSALAAHIEGLQRTLTKRNKRIAELEARLAAEEGSPFITEAREAGYKRGWLDCASSLELAADSVKRELDNLAAKGWEKYLEGDRLTIGGQRTGGDL